MTQDTTVMEGWFRNSCLHRLARKIEIKKFRTFRQQVGGDYSILYPVTEILCLGDLAGAVQKWGGLWEVLAVARGRGVHHRWDMRNVFL